MVVGVNFALGVPAVVPVWLAWYYLTQWPLVALGITMQEPTENDGVAIASAVILPVVGFAVLVWFLVGLLLRRRVRHMGALQFWLASFLAVITPTAALILVPLI
jgi:hypothetical protein